MPARSCLMTCRLSTRRWGGGRCTTGTWYGAVFKTCCMRATRIGGRWRKSSSAKSSRRRIPEPRPVTRGGGGGCEPDTSLRDFEKVPIKDDVDAYFEREVRPHVPDAWMDRSKDKVGYEINFNRHYYKYKPPRKLEQIDADLKQAEEDILRLLREVTD